MNIFIILVFLANMAHAENTGIEGTLVNAKGQHYFPCPYSSWKLNEKTLGCDPPLSRPKGDDWYWNEPSATWMHLAEYTLAQRIQKEKKDAEDNDYDAAKKKILSDSEATPSEIQKVLKRWLKREAK